MQNPCRASGNWPTLGILPVRQKRDAYFYELKSDQMRPNQQNNNKNNNRSRGRNGGRKHVNPLSRNFESNGPDVKVRGNAAHIAEKYMQLARDAQSSGDSVMAENYLQHAEHYFRIVSAAQPQPFGQVNDGDDYDDDMPEPNNRFSSPQPVQPAQVEQDQDGDGPQQNSAPRHDRDYRDNREGRPPREPRTRPVGEVQMRPIEPRPVVEAIVVNDDEAQVDAAVDGEVRKLRERRPRRRRPASEAGDPANAPQPDVGELPAFITAGGPANPTD